MRGLHNNVERAKEELIPHPISHLSGRSHREPAVGFDSPPPLQTRPHPSVQREMLGRKLSGGD